MTRQPNAGPDYAFQESSALDQNRTFDLLEKRGLARTAKIMIFRLKSNTWAQVWVVTQPGMNAVETDAIDQVLNRITLTTR